MTKLTVFKYSSSDNTKFSGLASPCTIPTALQNLEVEWPLRRFRALYEWHDAVLFTRIFSIDNALVELVMIVQ